STTSKQTGLQYSAPLNHATITAHALRTLSPSFKARAATYLAGHPQLLKEYNTRWFLICWHKNRMFNLALDRIKEVETDLKTDYEYKDFDAYSYLAYVVGVTVLDSQRPQADVFNVYHSYAPYT